MYVLFTFNNSNYRKRLVFQSPYLVYRYIKEKYPDARNILMTALMRKGQLYNCYLDDSSVKGISVELEKETEIYGNNVRSMKFAFQIGSEFKTLNGEFALLERQGRGGFIQIKGLMPIIDEYLKKAIKKTESDRFKSFIASNMRYSIQGA